MSILNRFVRNYFPPRLDGGNEGFSRVLYLDPSPDPECTEERIDEIFSLLDACPLLLTEKEYTPFEKLKITTDEDGWSTIPNKKTSGNMVGSAQAKNNNNSISNKDSTTDDNNN
jgi:hypothetical protein